MDRLRAVLMGLATPDSQRGDWFGWASVQVAHAGIGMAATVALWLAAGGWPLWIAAFVALAYAVGKELPDFARVRSWAGFRDSAYDALFVAAGGVFLAAAWQGPALLAWIVLGAALAGLAWGVWGRIAR